MLPVRSGASPLHPTPPSAARLKQALCVHAKFTVFSFDKQYELFFDRILPNIDILAVQGLCMLIPKSDSDSFLENYKLVMALINDGQYPEDMNEYGELREELFDRIYEIEKDLSNALGIEFIETIKQGLFGKYVYLKKYQKGYVLKNIDNGKFYQVLALTTPLEDLVPEYSIINTAILSYKGNLICDGLVIHQGVVLGKNMSKEIRDEFWQEKRAGNLIENA